MNTPVDIEQLNQQVKADGAFIQAIRDECKKSIVGQSHMIDRLLIGLLTKGHILLEGLPGLAKTLSIKTLASATNASFSRIQFTPDLLPADIVGTMIYNPGSKEFDVRKGPIFANFILADEINRAPAKVQSALLEAMQEKQVTIGKESYKLEEPFLVMATQNPVEQEGTYPLPEAQLDRFMLKVLIDYPEKEEERYIMRKNLGIVDDEKINPVVDINIILKARKTVSSIYMDEKIENYILDLVESTRPKNMLTELKGLISHGASPRASINLALAAKAHAFLKGRGYVTPEDVRTLAKDVLRHRLGLSYEAEAEGMTQEDVVHKILNAVPVP
ncbi:MAG TPA: MoxR family ATPase [Saprospiraceae bacterium]|nr:MoxR family ATPase [Saprospiraceae bacterium]